MSVDEIDDPSKPSPFSAFKDKPFGPQKPPGLILTLSSTSNLTLIHIPTARDENAAKQGPIDHLYHVSDGPRSTLTLPKLGLP